MKNILFIGPHPDDAELGCLGTMIYHVKRGDKVYVMIVTDGEQGNGNPERYDRINESIKCLREIGIQQSNIISLHMPDTKLLENREILFKRIEDFCVKKDVDMIYVNSNKDYHQDHIVTFEETVRAARKVPTILTYESNSSTLPTFSPNYFVDVSAAIDSKVKLLKMHESQTKKYFIKDIAVKSLAKFRGSQTKKLQYAEGFEILRMVVAE